MKTLFPLGLSFALLVFITIPVLPQDLEVDPPFPNLYPPCSPYQDYQDITAYDRCRFPKFFTYEQHYMAVSATRLQAELPDLNASFIMQTPRYDYDAPKNSHAPGDTVSFVAHIANRGEQPTGFFSYTWRIDGSPVMVGSNSSLAPSETGELTLNWTWESGLHVVQIELDPDDVIPEVSELNNVVSDQSNALSVGFWVEQSVYDWFNENQVGLGLGSVSWDDWAQRQLHVWNQMFADAITPLTPQGVIDRVRLDKVTVVPDGTLPPCATNFPAVDDKTIDLQWGFPSELVGIPSGHVCGALNFYFDNPEALNIEYSLMHELSHARYLVDLYGLNVHTNAAYLSGDVVSTASTLTVDREIEYDGNFSIPAYLSVGGELIICQSKTGNAFTNCARGEEGTLPRAHASGEVVNLAVVRLQDGEGNLVQGSPDLPLIGFDDHLYYNRYPDDLMSGGLRYDQHSAYAWNRIAGQRPVCGNYNAPCNIGEYLNEIPQNNILEVRNLSGEPIPGVRVEVYQAGPLMMWYGKVFDRYPDMIRYTNEAGRANIGSFPFGDSGSIQHTYGFSNALILLKLRSGIQFSYQFFEVTEMNEAYWSGLQDSAVYSITADLPAGVIPTYVYLPIVHKNYEPQKLLLGLGFEGSFIGSDGEAGTSNGVTFTEGYNGQGALFDENDTLNYASSDNIKREQGSIEFWLQPLWDGDDGESYVFFEVGEDWFNRMRIMKDGANNLRFMVWSADTEYGVAYNVSGWNAGEWHQVRVTWTENEMALYSDGTLRDFLTGITLPAFLDPTLHIGSTSGGSMQAQGVMDEFMVYSQP